MLNIIPELAIALMISVALTQAIPVFLTEIADSWSDTRRTFPLLLLVCAAGTILLVTLEMVERKWHPPSEYTRKLAHVGTGAIAFLTPVLFSTHWPVFLLAIMFSAVLLISRRFGWLAALHFPAGRAKGDFLFLWAVYLVFLLTDGNNLMFWVPILVLTVGDAAAALIGQRYGRTRYRFGENDRTVEGSMAFVVTAFLGVFILLLVSIGLPLFQIVALSLLVAIVAGSVEALTPRGLDNVSIPIGTLFVLNVFLG